MTINEGFVCPICKQPNPMFLGATPLMSDLRMDTLKCSSCETEWRVYSKVSEMQIEILRSPDKQPDSTEAAPAENE